MNVTIMNCKLIRVGVCAALSLALWCVCSTWAGSPVKLSDVISTADLEAEIEAKMSEIDTILASQNTFQESTAKLRLNAVQLTILSQALAEHGDAPKLKSVAPAMRDAARQLAQAGSFDDAKTGMIALRSAIDGHGPSNAAPDYDWSKLARLRQVMESLRDRTDQIRRAMRKSKDPAAESRHASVMAVLGLSIAAHADGAKNPSDRTAWSEFSLEFQREMTKTAVALRQQDKPAVLEHFKAAQDACEKCHEKFKK